MSVLATRPRNSLLFMQDRLVFEELIEGFTNLLFSEAELDCSMNRRSGQVAEFFLSLRGKAERSPLEDSHSLASDSFDNAVEFEPRVGLADCHRVHLGSSGNFANAGEHVARYEAITGNKSVNLVDELSIDWYSRGGVEFEKLRRNGHCVLV